MNIITNQAGDKNQSSHKGFKMKIEIGSKWQYKDGGVYEVVDYGKQTSPNGTYEDYVVWYCKVGETAKAYPRLESHFLDSFKPYEDITPSLDFTKRERK